MIEVSDIFRRFGGDYLDAFGDAMLPSHRRAINDIINCRTEVLGGHLYQCDTCHKPLYAYHSCKNRHCPKCHTQQTQQWLEKRRDELLPIPYFHVTITVPEALRPLFHANQIDAYSLFMKVCGEAILQLAKDPKHIGGLVGVLMVLHTWTQTLLLHPHVHCLVTGGGVSETGDWRPDKNGFIFPVQVLSRLVRGKFMTAMKRLRPDLVLPESAWQQQWVSHCTPWGVGEQAVLDYLARYAFRIAITNRRILTLDDQGVAFQYKDRKQSRWRTCRVTGEEFMRRFLQHVLPQGFHKVRYFGLWNPQNRHIVQRVRLHFALTLPTAKEKKLSNSDEPVQAAPFKLEPGAPCPCCDSGILVLVRSIPRPLARAP
ncbi:MAG: transposase [Magnetococcales bacterium]|nr:transposase [Magnetococcales bacterium]